MFTAFALSCEMWPTALDHAGGFSSEVSQDRPSHPQRTCAHVRGDGFSLLCLCRLTGSVLQLLHEAMHFLTYHGQVIIIALRMVVIVAVLIEGDLFLFIFFWCWAHFCLIVVHDCRTCHSCHSCGHLEKAVARSQAYRSRISEHHGHCSLSVCQHSSILYPVQCEMWML